MAMNGLGQIMAATLVLGLTACASASKPSARIVWTGGEAARLAGDEAQCHKEVADLDVNQSATYSDPRYGVTSAMAAQVGRDNPLTDQSANIRSAAFATCMTDKGWKAQ